MKKILVGSGLVIGNLFVQAALAFFIVKFLILPSLKMPEITFTNSDGSATFDSVETIATKFDDLRLCTVVALEQFVINPSNTRGRKFLVFSLEIYLSGLETPEIDKVQENALRDAIHLLVARKTHDWLSNVHNRIILREELKILTQKIMSEAVVKEIFITKFVMQ
jgi:flagellar basal body-associated protein FliL